jgi:hypothetical protein
MNHAIEHFSNRLETSAALDGEVESRIIEEFDSIYLSESEWLLSGVMRTSATQMTLTNL